MSLYAAQPARRTQQIVTDVLFLLVVVGAIWLATTVHDAVLGLSGPAQDVEDAGSGLAGGLTDAGEFLGGVPLVGDEVAVPFDDAAAAAGSMESAGAGGVDAVERLAFWLGVVVAAVPIVLVAFQYLPGRLLFVRRSAALRRFGGPTGLGRAETELLALRALAREPLGVLRGVGDDVAARWRAGDPETLRRLAALEFRACGLRPPTGPAPRGGPGPTAAPPPGPPGPGSPPSGPTPTRPGPRVGPGPRGDR